MYGNTNGSLNTQYSYLFQVHGEVISSEPDLTEKVQGLCKGQQDAWDRLQTMFNQTLCLVNFMRSATL